ncbi:MAG: HEAT repeat domain-containing protein [Phycisphaerae bacterium]
MIAHRIRTGIVVVGCLAGSLLTAGCMQDGQTSTETLDVRPSQAIIDARHTLLKFSDSSNPVLRAYALESTAELLEAKAGGTLMQALEDRHYSVRLHAAKAIGDIRYRPALDRLRTLASPRPSVGEPDLSVLAAIIYAMMRLDDDTYARQLALMLQHREPSIRASADWAMGAVGHPSGVPILRAAVKDERNETARQTMIESLALLGEEKYQRFLEASKFSSIENRVSAIRAMGQIGTIDLKEVLRDLAWSNQPPQVRVAAIGQLARLGEVDEVTLDYVRRCVRQSRPLLEELYGSKRKIEEKEVIALRQMAAEALGWTDREVVVNDLHPLLGEATGGAQVAAATSILRLLKDYRTDSDTEMTRSLEGQDDGNGEADDVEEPRRRPKLHTSGARD